MAVPATRFPLATNVLSDIASDVLREAKSGGATASETEVSQGFGQSVTVRKGEVETIAYNRDKGIGVTVYVGTRRGHANTADFSQRTMRALDSPIRRCLRTPGPISTFITHGIFRSKTPL